MSLSQTLARLKQAGAAFAAQPGGVPALDRLGDLPGAFANPGNLRARCYVPANLSGPAPLLVVLHGCTQTAADYDHGSGWSRLADRHGFAVLFPEQRRENNPNLCFNWFQNGDTSRGQGEAASIAAMVAAMAAAYPVDAKRVFVTGLSAGGAMTATMLAAYPDVFAGGAIIAGLPHGSASDVRGAFEAMGGRAAADERALIEAVRRAAPSHRGPSPRVSIWHGSADRTVAPGNAEALARQWAGAHGLRAAPDRVETIDGQSRSVWAAPDGGVAVEHWTIAGMGHGTPLAPGTGEGQSGTARAHMLDVGLSSTDRIAAFFGLAPDVRPGSVAARPVRPEARPSAPPPPRRHADPAKARPRPAPSGGIGKTIEDALRAAGLLR